MSLFYPMSIKKEFPDIGPHNGDPRWEEEAFEQFKAQNYREAEALLKKIYLSQPGQYIALAGLAYLYYMRGEFNRADWFMDEAMYKADDMLEAGLISREVVDELELNLDRLVNRRPLETPYGLIEPGAAEPALFAEDIDAWFKLFYDAPSEQCYEMLMLAFEQSSPLEEFDSEAGEASAEELAILKKMDSICFEMSQELLNKREMARCQLFLEKLRIYQPQIYRNNFPYYGRYLILFALYLDEHEKLKEYLELYIEDPVKGVDELIGILQLLQFHKLPALAEYLSRKAYHEIRDTDKLISGGDVYFKDSLINNIMDRTYYRLQQGETILPAEINGELQEFNLIIEEGFLGLLLSQLAPGNDHQKIEDSLQAKTETNRNKILTLLKWQFCKFMLEQKGLCFDISAGLFQWMKRLLEQEANDDDDDDIYDYHDKIRVDEDGLPDNFFDFPQESFEHMLMHMEGFLSNQRPRVAALLWGIPFVYEFFQRYGVVSEAYLEEIKEKFAGMQEQFIHNHAKDLWKYSFIHNWPPSVELSEEALSAKKEQIKRSFTEVVRHGKSSTHTETEKGRDKGSSELLDEALEKLEKVFLSMQKPEQEQQKDKENQRLAQDRQEVAQVKQRTKQITKRKAAKKQRRKQRK